MENGLACATEIENWFAPGRWRSTEPTLGTGLRWHPQLEVMNQGTSWHGAGLHTTEDEHRALMTAERAVYPDGRVMTELRVWPTTDPSTVVMEWRDEGTLWTGRQVENGGITLVVFEDGAVRRVSNFQNTAFLQAVERGWEGLVRRDVQLNLPAYHTLELPDLAWRPSRPSPRARLYEQRPARRFSPPYTSEERMAAGFGPLAERDHAAIVRPIGCYWEFQGTRWPLAGRNVMQGDESIGGLVEVIKNVWVDLYFTHLATWGSADGDWGFMEWTSDAVMWNGAKFVSQGFSALRFDDAGRNTEHREYLNVALLEAASGDWRPQVESSRFAALACASTYEEPADAWRPIPISPDFDPSAAGAAEEVSLADRLPVS